MQYKYSKKSLLVAWATVLLFSTNFKTYSMNIQTDFTLPRLEYNDFIDRSLRLKVTNQCSFTCSFCHNEGTELSERSDSRASILLDSSITQFEPVEDIMVPDIEDLVTSKFTSLMSQLNKYKEFGYNQIHLTGGEPTSHPQLVNLIKLLRQNGFVVKITSNGQFNTQKLTKYVSSGLSGITFSILSLDPQEFLKTQLRTYHTEEAAVRAANKAIKNTIKNILEAKKLGLNVKVNAIILSANDKARVDRLADFAEQNNVTLSLLPCVLSSDPTAGEKAKMEQLAFQYVLGRGARYIKTMRPLNTSGGTHHFVLPNGNPMLIKYIKNYQPEILCSSCEHFGKLTCTENFYGLRIEFRGKVPFVRLCVQKNTPESLMPLDEFVKKATATLTPCNYKII